MFRLKQLAAATAAAALLSLSAAGAYAAPLLAGSGWQSDEAPSLNVPTANSPWTFSVGAGQSVVFSITDAFIVTDTFTVEDAGGTILLTTTPGILPTLWTPGTDTPDNAWAEAAYSKGQLTFGAGDYALTIRDIADAGLPAGLYVRLDTVPEPGTLALLGLGLAGLAATRRRKQ